MVTANRGRPKKTVGTIVDNLKDKPKNRRATLKKALMESIIRNVPLLNRSFDMDEFISPKGTRGKLRDYLKGDLKMPDRYALREIIQELVRKDGFLFHKAGRMYARLK